MNSKSIRRLASDHASLHRESLPPNYFFAPDHDLGGDASDLTQLNICLAGPRSTPYESGLFNLHLAIPDTYPNEPPKAFFKTKIFHPNVDDATGAVCVETLKRDWDQKLTLRDVLLTVNCLLLYPNPSSALNAEAGLLLEQEDGWEAFAKRARFMTSMHAKVASSLKSLVVEAQHRGEATDGKVSTARPRRTRNSRMSNAAPVQTTAAERDDVFGASMDKVQEEDRENQSMSTPPSRAASTRLDSPSKTRQTTSADLDTSTESMDMDMEAEYPPSPKKSPQKGRFDRPASELDSTVRPPFGQLFPPRQDVAPAVPAPPRSGRARRSVMRRTTRGLDDFSEIMSLDKVRKPQTRSSPRGKAKSSGRSKLEDDLWDACGHDVGRWNRGDFGGKLDMKMPRW